MAVASNGGNDRVTNAVLATRLDHTNQLLAHVVDELRALRADSIGKDLYEAHRSATDAELTRIRDQCRTDTEVLARELATEREGRAALRRQLIVTTVAGGFTIAAAVVGLFAAVLAG